MRAGVRASLAAAAVAIALFTTSAHANPGTRPSPGMIGVAHAEMFGAAGARGAKLMGARYDRIDFLPTYDHPEWDQAAADAIFETEALAGLRLLPILVDYHTPFTSANNASFASWAAWFMRRYGAGGQFWRENPELDARLAPTIFEVGNEAYGWWFYPDAPNAAGYDDLFKRVVSAGRAINPGFRFLFSAGWRVFTADGRDLGQWAQLVTAADPTIGSYIDGLAVHPYGARSPGDLTTMTQAVRNQFAANGVSAPVYVTEVGRCTGPTPLRSGPSCGSNTDQANAVTAWFRDFRATPWLYALIVYQYQDCSADNPCARTNLYLSDTAGRWWGLVDRFGVPKAGYFAYKKAARRTP